MWLIFPGKTGKKAGSPPHFILKALMVLAIWTAEAAVLHASMQTIVPGGDWYHTSGNIIYATEGGILNYNGTYYLWGMDRSANNSTFTGVNLYSSPDLKNWTFVNKILKSTSNTLLGGGVTIERAKILYNSSTNQFVMWMHYEDHNAYNVAEVAYATCGTIGGDYTFQSHFQPMGLDSRDMNVYQDTDGKAYLICTTLGNQNVSLFALDPTYTSVTSEVFRGAASNNMACEGHAIIKSGGYYFWIMSWCSGWDFNDNHYYYATSLAGPWTSGGNIATANAHTYESQGGWAFQVTGSGGSTFIYMGDRWSVNNFSMSRMVMLPISVNGTTLQMPWHDQWDIDTQTGLWQTGPQTVWNGPCKIINRHSGKVLDVNGGSTADSAVVDQYTDNGGANQKWTITNLGGSDYTITSVNSGKVLDITSSGRTAGSTAIQYTSNGGYNQKWHIIDSSRGAGYYRLVNVNTLCKTIEIPAGSTTDWTQAALGNFNYSDYQEWQILSDYSPTRTPNVTAVATATRTMSASASVSPTGTYTKTLTPTNTRTQTASVSPTWTCTKTPTPTFTSTLSATPSIAVSKTFTATNLITQTMTNTPVNTNTAAPSATRASSSTETAASTPQPSLTITATQQITMTSTAVHTNTGTATAVDTQASTATRTATQTIFISPSTTYTAVASQTATVTPTVTLTTIAASRTATQTNTGTTTPSVTSTRTLIPDTPTFTRTVSPSLTRTSTAIPTATATLTYTPMPTATTEWEDRFEIRDILIYPNPYDPENTGLKINISITRAASDIKIRIYTVSFRRVMDLDFGPINTKEAIITIPAGRLTHLSAGIYHVVVTGKSDGNKAISKPVELVIMR